MLKVLKILLLTIIIFCDSANVSAISKPNDNTSWSMYRGNLQHTGLSRYDTSYIDGREKWRFKTDGGIKSPPIIDSNGVIYFGSEDNHFYALNPDGSQKWKYKANGAIRSSGAIDKDGNIYFVAIKNLKVFDKSNYDITKVEMGISHLYVLNTDGTLKWEFKLGGLVEGISASPIIGPDGIIYISSGIPAEEEGGGRFYALNPDGTVKWEQVIVTESTAAIDPDGTIYVGARYPYIKKKTLANGIAGVIMADDTVHVGEYPSYLFAFDPNGKLKWKISFGGPVVVSSPAIGTDGTIYIGSNDNRILYYNFKIEPPQDQFWGKLWAINPDGTKKWHFETKSWIQSSPSIDVDGTIYVGSYDKNFYAINANGKLKWKYETENIIPFSSSIGADGTIYTGSGDGKFYAFNTDGTVKWTFASLVKNTMTDGAIAKDGTIYVGSWDGNLYAIGGAIQTLDNNIRNIKMGPVIPFIVLFGILLIILLKSKKRIGVNKKSLLIGGVIVTFILGVTCLLWFNKSLFIDSEENNKTEEDNRVLVNPQPYPLSYAQIKDISIETDNQNIYITFQLDGEMPDMRLKNQYQGDKLTEILLTLDLTYKKEDKFHHISSYEQMLLLVRGYDGGHNNSGIASENRGVFSYKDDIYNEPKRGGMIKEGGFGNNYITQFFPLASFDLTLNEDFVAHITGSVKSEKYPLGAAYSSFETIIKFIPAGQGIEVKIGQLKEVPFKPVIIRNNNSANDNDKKKDIEIKEVGHRLLEGLPSTCIDVDCDNKHEDCVQWHKHGHSCYRGVIICSKTPCKRIREHCNVTVWNDTKNSYNTKIMGYYVTKDGKKHLIDTDEFFMQSGGGRSFGWDYEVDSNQVGKCDYTIQLDR